MKTGHRWVERKGNIWKDESDSKKWWNGQSEAEDRQTHKERRGEPGTSPVREHCKVEEKEVCNNYIRPVTIFF